MILDKEEGGGGGWGWGRDLSTVREGVPDFAFAMNRTVITLFINLLMQGQK